MTRTTGAQAATGTNGQHPHYSMVIEWSDEDQAYIVSIPEFPGHHTHGDTYEEAVRQSHDLIDSLIIWAEKDGKPLPQPKVFAGR
ncbi:MAG TPA: type II toxin-antitoxin system HicB family antitoxin [Ktedonobacterales bacterium]|nr:type II toxin-antitoxin system HicB family antitoxin [Ktedonobacterales bacterium]